VGIIDHKIRTCPNDGKKWLFTILEKIPFLPPLEGNPLRFLVYLIMRFSF
jgi:hypothetical protein